MLRMTARTFWGDVMETAFIVLMAAAVGAGLSLLGVYVGARFL
jgi:hypothetical protein